MKPGGMAGAIPSSAVTWAPLLTALAVLAVAVLVITPQPAGLFWDDGVDLVSARSLALGDGYRFAWAVWPLVGIVLAPGTPLEQGATDLDVAALLRDGPEFPRLIPIDTLPGGGVAFRVQHGDSKSVPESSGIRPTAPPTIRNR